MTLTRFADVITLPSTRTADPLAAGIERFVGLEHIEPENLHIRSWGNVAEGTTFTNTFQRGQVLFGKRRAYQRKVAVAEFDGVCSSDIYVFESKDPTVLLPELLPFILQSEGFYEYAVKTSAGSLSPRTNWTHLANYEFPLLPVDEQHRIADLLWAADDVCEKLQNLFSKAEVLKKKVFEGILTGELKNDFLDSDEIYENGSKVDLGSLPSLRKGWFWKRADEVCDFITKGATPSKKNTSQGTGEIPFIKVYNLTFDGTLDFSVDPTFITKVAHTKELNRSKVFPGDVLMNIVGPPLGKVSIVPDTFPEWNINQAIVYFRPLGEYDSGFLTQYLLQDFTQQWFYSRSKKTSGQRNLTLEMCRDLPLPMPPKSAIETIYQITQSVNSAVNAAKQDLENATNLRKTLLNQLLSDNQG